MGEGILDWRVRESDLRVHAIFKSFSLSIRRADLPTFSRRDGVNKFLKSLRIDDLINGKEGFAVAQNVGTLVDEPGVVSVSATYLAGNRNDAIVAAHLRAIDPGFDAPVQRFQAERSEADSRILDEFRRRGRGDLLTSFGDEPTGTRLRRGQRKGAPTREPLGYTIARVPHVERRIWRDGQQYQVRFQAGMPALQALLFVKAKEMEHKYGRLDEVRLDGALLDEMVGWFIFERYIGLHLHLPGYEEVWRAWAQRKNVIALAAASRMLPGSRDLARTITGDVATLQFQATGRTAIFPGVKRLSDLLRRLERLGYPRMEVARASEDRNRLDAILRAIAELTEVAYVGHVDWRPLLAR